MVSHRLATSLRYFQDKETISGNRGDYLNRPRRNIGEALLEVDL